MAAWSKSKTDFVFMLEDDTVPCTDAWLYMQWAANKFKNEPLYKTVACWNNGDHGWKPGQPWDEKEVYRIMRQSHFSAWGWGSWRRDWIEMHDNWTKGDDHFTTSWDVHLHRQLGDRLEIAPSISRASNIGEKGGTHRGRSFPIVMSSGFVDVDMEGLLPYWFSNEK